MRIIQAAFFLLLVTYSPWLYAACSAYGLNGQAAINEVYKLTTGSGVPSFVEIKIVDTTINDSVYDAWRVEICSKNDCDSYALSSFDNQYPWLYLQSPALDDSDISFKNDGFDISLRDGAGNIIDYMSVNGRQEQNLNACNLNDLAIPEHQLSTPGGAKIIERVGPDGSGNWDIVTSNSVQPTPGSDNETSKPTPPAGFSCSAADSFTPIVDDDFSADIGNWSAVDFNRSVLNWPGQTMFASPSENQSVVFAISGGELAINGAVSSGGDNEYGMVEHNFATEFTTTDPNQYSVYTKLRTNYGNNTNNDFAIVFGYQDDENYYLARWTKFGATYSNDNNFPGNYRQLDLVKVSGGVATTLDSLARTDSVIETYADDDATGGNNNDGNITMKVVVTDDGTGVCVGKDDGSSMTLQLFSDESPLLHSAGVFSYDNDIGIELDEFEVRCDNCPPIAVSAAFYEFEDADTDFSNGVEDSNGNLDGINLGGDSTADGKFCRAFDSQLNTSSATSNAFETGVTLSGGFTKGSVSFWFNSNTPWNSGAERTLWDASFYFSPWSEWFNTNFTLKLDSAGRLLFSVEERAFYFVDDVSHVTSESAANRAANTWYYVTSTWDYDNGRFQIYVDGSLVAANDIGSRLTFPNFLNKIVIGDNASANVGTGILPSPNSANGKFDNVKIYNKVLSQAEIIADMAGVPCVTPDPTFVIEHDGNGITCLPEPVNIYACLDASCSATDTSVNTTVNILVNGGGSQTVNIVNGVGTPTPSFNYTDTVNNAILSSSADFVCRNTSLVNSLGQTDADCGVNFSDTGFVFDTINNQVSGEDFNQAVTIRAVQADENGACSPLFNNTTSIGFAMQYQAPTTTTLNDYTLGGTPINKVVGQPSTADYVDIDVPFNASGVGTLPTNIYFDAGQINLHAYKVIPATPELNAVTLLGNSNNFWVQPHRFEVTSALAGALITHPAGEDFSYVIKAVNKQGATTTNYLPGNVQASVIRSAPVSAAAIDGVFTYADGLGTQVVDLGTFTNRAFAFINGEASVSTAEYDEVGTVSFDVQDNNYGGIGLLVEANAVNLGRFIPKYFEQTVVEHGNITGTCGPWAYSGELTGAGDGAISYGTDPILSIVARNAKDDITRNYRNFGAGDNFAPLVKEDVVITAPTEDLNQVGALGTKMQLTSDISHAVNALAAVTDAGGIDVGGEFTYTFNPVDHFVYSRDANAVYTPFNAEFDIEVTSISDSDGVVATTLTDVNITSNVEIRFGRLVLANSYGPETSNLPQPFTTEYLIDVATMTFRQNSDDTCTAITNDPASWTITNGDTSNGLTASDIGIQGAGGVLASGEFDGVSLSSNNGEQGSVGVEYTTPIWLQFDWDGDGNHDDNANAVATFGRYRGNDRIIYWKEVNN